jgi:hypothetical protein
MATKSVTRSQTTRLLFIPKLYELNVWRWYSMSARILYAQQEWKVNWGMFLDIFFGAII